MRPCAWGAVSVQRTVLWTPLPWDPGYPNHPNRLNRRVKWQKPPRDQARINDSLKDRFQQTYSQWFGLVDEAYAKMPGSQTAISAKSKFLVAVVDGFILQGLLETQTTSVKEIVDLMLKTIDL